MKKALLLIVALAALALPSLSTAASTVWRTYYVSEIKASELLEKRYDSAYCDGIARFGKRGSFPYEKFRIFDCTTKIDDTFCSDVRYKSVQQGSYWRLVKIRNGDCF